MTQRERIIKEIELLKASERAQFKRSLEAIAEAESFLRVGMRYSNEDCDVIGALVSARTAPLSWIDDDGKSNN